MTARPKTRRSAKSSARGFAALSNRSLRVPSYRCKPVHGRKYACVSLPDGQGGRRDILLGRYGTKESKVEYARVIAEWQAADRPCLSQLPRPTSQSTNCWPLTFPLPSGTTAMWVARPPRNCTPDRQRPARHGRASVASGLPCGGRGPGQEALTERGQDL